jgi:hypothetical protein
MPGYLKGRALRVLAVLAVCQLLSACVVVPAHHYRHRAHVQQHDAYGGPPPPAREYRHPRYRDYRDHRDHRDHDRRDWDGRR